MGSPRSNLIIGLKIQVSPIDPLERLAILAGKKESKNQANSTLLEIL
jgi:hypothetical protein